MFNCTSGPAATVPGPVGHGLAGATQEGSKALLKFGADLVRCSVGNLFDPVSEELNPFSLPKQCQGLNASTVRCSGASLPLQAFQNERPAFGPLRKSRRGG